MTAHNHRDGILGVAYHEGRKQRVSFKYRMQRRGLEVARAIQAYHPQATRLLDLGVADGLMLPVLQQACPALRIVGLDLSPELLHLADFSRFAPVLADASLLPFATASFQAISAAAIIEHVCEPQRMLAEMYRVLTPGGICILTTPDPFFERIGSHIARLPEDQHRYTFTLASLKTLLEQAGFDVLKAEKFMVSPQGMPYEDAVETFLKKIGLGWLLLNQLFVGRRPL